MPRLNAAQAQLIGAAAPFIDSPVARHWRRFLHPLLIEAMDVIDAVRDGNNLTYAEIGEATGLAPDKVGQIVRALIAGGYPMVAAAATPKYQKRTGRPPLRVKMK